MSMSKCVGCGYPITWDNSTPPIWPSYPARTKTSPSQAADAPVSSMLDQSHRRRAPHRGRERLPNHALVEAGGEQ
jgi:hypothetical protein